MRYLFQSLMGEGVVLFQISVHLISLVVDGGRSWFAKYSLSIIFLFHNYGGLSWEVVKSFRGGKCIHNVFLHNRHCMHWGLHYEQS